MKLLYRKRMMTTALTLDESGLYECSVHTGRFISAEGCYSCVIISSSLAAALDLRVRISPLVLSDHSDVPVFWFRGSLVRCIHHWNSRRGTCSEALRAWRITRANYTAHAYRRPETPINAVFKRAIVVQDCFNMRWICRSAQRAALHALSDNFGLGGQLKPLEQEETVHLRAGNEVLPRATLVMTSMIKPSVNIQIIEAPLFHFRKWVDYGRWRPTSLDRNMPPVIFSVKNSGFVCLQRQCT